MYTVALPENLNIAGVDIRSDGVTVILEGDGRGTIIENKEDLKITT